MNIALIILAAGNSSRLGQAKQLLHRGDQTMIEYIVSQCTQSELGPVYVVTGAYHDEISLLVDNDLLLHNTSWQQGMSSSIAFAIRNIDQASVDGAVIILSDQVYLDKNILVEIAEVALTNPHQIINCQYQKGMGPPTYFDKSLFAELEQLSGDDGAKPIVMRHADQSTSIDFLLGDVDLDNESDLSVLESL